MSLTEKQRRFCEEYAILGNATEAAKRAGYSERTARSVGAENLTKPDILHFISELQAEEKRKRMATADEVLQFFAQVMRDGKESMKNRLKAAENLARRFGLNNEENSNGEDGINITLAIENVSGGADD